MAAKKRGLGRGLDALLGSSARSAPAVRSTQEQAPAALRAVPDTATAAAQTPATPVDGALCMLPVDIISRGKYQPRVDMHKE